MAEETQSDITALTVQLLSAFVSNNSIPSESLADLIKSTRAALTQDDAALATEAAALEHVPAVSVRKSLASADYIISLIDGKPYKTLKRHLATHGLTPEEYRERYNLPKSYPLVAKSYSEARRAIAEKLGLGTRAMATKADEPAEIVVASAPVAQVDASVASRAKRALSAPVKKRPPSTKDAATAALPEAVEPAPETTALKKESRKRLSIATSKKAKVNAEVKAAPAEPVRAAAKTRVASKKTGSAALAKPTSKSRSLKSALKAAGDHLNSNASVQDAAEAE